MLLVPAAMQFARPATLGALAMVATDEDDELQWVFSVMSWVLASLNVPVAVNCSVPPAVAVGATGVIAIETSVPVPTVNVVVPVMPDAVADMVAVPPFLPCAMPDERMEAMLGLEDLHDTPLRLVAMLASLKVPVAVNLISVPFEMRGLTGVMVIETKCAVETVSPVDPVIEPKPAVIVVLPVATLEARP